MKRNFVLLIVISLFGFVSCSKNAKLYEGIFIKGNGCQNIVSITKSVHGGLPVNTSFYVYFVDDSTRVKQLKDREKIAFKIMKYNRDTVGHFANCLWADYDATIELEN
ncbi:MAG TPA: hypothetical protein ENH49_01705 [Candidatus Marinimicrobia bacterium]|nr:hypothetical protein [Candidatus Neomarinimicrobiota bacterium]